MLTRTALIMVLFLAFSAQLLAAEPVVVRVEGVEGEVWFMVILPKGILV